VELTEGANRIRKNFLPNETPKKHRTRADGREAGDNIGPSGLSWTPLERQVSMSFIILCGLGIDNNKVQQLKDENPNVVLMIQDGYKYR
jgi:hypothetical protein